MFPRRSRTSHFTPGRTTRLRLQQLEDRSTPAAAFVTFPDHDGDLVRITASKSGVVAPPLDLTDLTLSGGASGQLLMLNLIEPGFEDAKIVISATKKPGGDGLVNVGYINAVFRDLDQVVINGDLGKIIAGNPGSIADPGINRLQVRSMGAMGTQTGAPNLGSSITGKLGELRIARDYVDASLNIVGGVDGKIGSVFIGGDLVGGDLLNSGRIHSDGSMGNVSIGGDVIGGVGNDSGQIFSGGSMGRLTIGRDLVGGAGDFSGRVRVQESIARVRVGGDVIGSVGAQSGKIETTMGDIGDVYVGGDLIGSFGVVSGSIGSMGDLGNVRIGGSVLGGVGDSSGSLRSVKDCGNVLIGGDVFGGSSNLSGQVVSGGVLGNVRIGGDLVGGSITGAASIYGSGIVMAVGRIGSVYLRGSLIAGIDDSTGTLSRSGAIIGWDDLGPVSIGGSIIGNKANPARNHRRGSCREADKGIRRGDCPADGCRRCPIRAHPRRLRPVAKLGQRRCVDWRRDCQPRLGRQQHCGRRDEPRLGWPARWR